jgi:acyl-CoA thioesterase FadM
MARLKIELPDKFHFTTTIPVRITDINYGGHAGNDTILGLIHEARMQYLQDNGYQEMDFEGVGMIMADVSIEFKSELFYGDIVIASVIAAGFSKVSFDLYYKLEKEVSGKRISVAVAKTGMVCYNYDKKKIAVVPEKAKRQLTIGNRQ